MLQASSYSCNGRGDDIECTGATGTIGSVADRSKWIGKPIKSDGSARGNSKRQPGGSSSPSTLWTSNGATNRASPIQFATKHPNSNQSAERRRPGRVCQQSR